MASAPTAFILPGLPPVTAGAALRRLEAVRTFDDLVRWSHELAWSHLLGEDGYTEEVVPYWGRLWPGEVPPQAVSPDGRIVHLPSGETAEWMGGPLSGEWHRIEQLPEAA